MIETVQTESNTNMSPKISTRQDTRTALLEAGMDIMVEKGYTNTGIQEVLVSIGVPKGSFYHYFDSKEDFAVQIIQHFDSTYSANLLRTLRNPDAKPLARLKIYCEIGKEKILANECKRGCLIGNLSQEMAGQSEVLRESLSHVMGKWRDLFAACIEEGQKAGEIRSDAPAHDLAEVFLASWEGAVMRAKTTKCCSPIDVFMDVMLERLLRA